ncbi:carbohydrate ABC transporter permease [Pseudothermotoga sp.]|uniref:carbohydrate ABC transporter permease n=1 Tax=Pseudothermotoga sp. TaxID=2033661 RepID=UPI0031F70210
MKKRLLKLFLFTIALFIVVVELVPILVIIANGFKKDIDIWTKSPFYFKPTVRSYYLIFSNRDFKMSLRNSLTAATISALTSVFFASLAAFGFTRFDFKLKFLLLIAILLTRMIPQITLALPFYLLFRALGLKDNIVGLSVAHISFNLPYVLALLIPFFASVPRDYEEAARIDGCKMFGVFWRITLPLSSAGLVVAFVFAFLMSWNEFLYALVLTGPNAKTAPIVINAFLGQYAPLWGQLSASSTIMLLPVFAITLGFQRYILKGLWTGGLKG